jgi:hypothetical protein
MPIEFYSCCAPQRKPQTMEASPASAPRESAWMCFSDCPEPLPPSDATNYLGGIGDVLEDKSRRGSLEHLGDLAGFGLYANDRQICQVSYRVTSGQGPRYHVQLWELDDLVERGAG